MAIDFLISKAWKEAIFTKVYAILVGKLVKKKYDWDQSRKGDFLKKKLLCNVE